MAEQSNGVVGDINTSIAPDFGEARQSIGDYYGGTMNNAPMIVKNSSMMNYLIIGVGGYLAFKYLRKLI